MFIRGNVADSSNSSLLVFCYCKKNDYTQKSESQRCHREKRSAKTCSVTVRLRTSTGRFQRSASLSGGEKNWTSLKPFVLFSISVTVTVIGAELSYYRAALWDTQQSSVQRVFFFFGGEGSFAQLTRQKWKKKWKKKKRKHFNAHRILDQYDQQSASLNSISFGSSINK